MERMSGDRSTKLYSNKPEGLRLVGRPKKRWLDEVEQDLKQMGEAGEDEPRIETNGGVF
jgi:hypothetical protein